MTKEDDDGENNVEWKSPTTDAIKTMKI